MPKNNFDFPPCAVLANRYHYQCSTPRLAGTGLILRPGGLCRTNRRARDPLPLHPLHSLRDQRDGEAMPKIVKFIPPNPTGPKAPAPIKEVAA